jgi:peptide/nickel transport system substrate-binding protein
MEKKNIAIMVLIIALVASGVGNIVLYILSVPEKPTVDTSFAYRRATSSGPYTLEIVDSWDSASNDVLEQVVETLFFYDLSDVDLPLTYELAYSYWWKDTTHVQIKLREGIVFHDGTDFNAEAAKWNLDRLLYLTNCTGTNTGEVAHTQSLWMFPDGITPIIKSVETVGDYNITITTNGAYAPFISTLSYINSGMLSPTAHAGDATSFLSLRDKPIGTGPFTYESYTVDVDVRMKRWDGYWKGPANFPWVIYLIYDDATTAHNAMLSYELDTNAMASDQNIVQYEADPKFTVKRFTNETGKPSLVYQYLGFNNKKYNVTWRKAFSYAFNYSYVIDELRLGNAFRATGAISPGFGEAYNDSVPAVAVPDGGDLATARAVMQSMGFGTTFTTDKQWTDKAASTTPFLTVYYQFNTGNSFRTNLGVAVEDWLKKIGVATVQEGLTWDAFLNYLFDQYDNLGIYAIGWAPDYLDPYNMLDPLFNPMSSSNSAQVNDTTLNAMLAAALAETDLDARNIIYKNIQAYMATEGFFHAPLYHSNVVSVHLANIYNVPYNAMGALRIYPQYRSNLYPPY